MRITRLSVARSCAVCERTLLMGERSTRFTPDGENFVDVCPLCQDIALEYGWLKEGSPTTPTVSTERQRRRLSLSSLFESRKDAVAEAPVADEPFLRRLSEPEREIVEAADLFNQTDFRRTVAGIANSPDELYEQMVEYYKDTRHVGVLGGRREGPDRPAGKPADEFQEKRLSRDRRRRRAGAFPDTGPPEAG